MNEALWDSAYEDMCRALRTGESLPVGHALLPFDAVLEYVNMDEEVRLAFHSLLNQQGVQSVVAMRDFYKHKCAKAYANWVITVYEMEHRNEKV